MGLINVVTNKARRVQFIKNDKTVFTIDCTINEKHERESPPTEFPLESGQSITDNIIIKPFSLELTGIISDTPINAITEIITTLATAVLPPAGVIAGGAAALALSKALAGADSPSISAYKQLLQLQELKEPFQVVTTLRVYNNMYVKNISVPRDAQTGQILIFTVSLVQLLIAVPQVVDISIYGNPNVSAGQADKGKQQVDQNNDVVNAFKRGQSVFNGFIGGS